MRRSPERIREKGFTLIEVIVVVAVGAILVSMALRGFGSASSRLAVQNARQGYAAMQARARAYAVERGDLVRLHADPVGDSIWIDDSGGNRIETSHFGESRNVDIQSGGAGVVTLCMNPRGFGETSCNSFSSGARLVFEQGGQTAGVRILPLGQLQW